MPPDVHSAILELGILLGYFTEENKQGVCRGFTMAWISACMVGEEEHFKQRIQCILDEEESLPEKLSQVKEKIKRHETLANNEVYLHEIPAFYEQILLFQSPWNYADIFKALRSQQDVMAISKIASSQSIIDKGGLNSIHAVHGLYTKNEIATYLERLAKAIDSINWQENASLSFMLGNYNHAQGLIYIPAKHSWSLMNINEWPPIEFIDIQELAQTIFKGFMTLDYIAFSINLIATMEDLKAKEELLPQLVMQLNDIKKDYPITAETVARPGVDKLIDMAVIFDDVDTIKELGAQNVDLNKANSSGETPAFIAALRGFDQLIKALGILKANLNKARNDGGTPAFIAAQEGHAHVINALGEQNTDLNKANTNGETPAFIAAQQGHAHVIKALGEQNADLNQARNGGATPAFIAAQQGHAHVIKVLGEQNADLNQASDGVTPAFVAAHQGHAHVIKALGEQNADLNQARNTGATPAFAAAQQGHAHVIKALGELNADLNQARNDGETPASTAARNGHIDVIYELGAQKVDFNKAKDDGATPLFIAAQCGHTHVVRYLVHYPGVQQLPLILSAASLRAFSESLSEVTQQKIEAHITEKLSKGGSEATISVTPEEIAYIMGHDEIVEILKSAKQEIKQRFDDFKEAAVDGRTQAQDVSMQSKMP